MHTRPHQWLLLHVWSVATPQYTVASQCDLNASHPASLVIMIYSTAPRDGHLIGSHVAQRSTGRPVGRSLRPRGSPWTVPSVAQGDIEQERESRASALQRQNRVHIYRRPSPDGVLYIAIAVSGCNCTTRI